MTDLSPAALAVWQQYCGIVEEHGPARLGLAAALRAAADRVAPAGWLPHERVRHELLTIATELETFA